MISYPYHATTPLTAHQLLGAMQSAVKQDEAVMAIFRAKRCPLSPSQVHAIGVEQGRQWLATSVRRSMSNLARAGALVHLHGHSRPGPHGKPETLWALPASNDEVAAVAA